MKRRISLYAVAWIVLLALFNVIAFVSVGWTGQEKYTSSFWIGYVLITIAFIGQLICTITALNTDNAKKLFYGISLIKTSYIGLIVSFVVGGLCMLISPLPYWIGGILCAIILGINILSVVKATAAVDEVEKIDKKIADKVNQVADKARELAEELHRKVTPEELAKETGMAEKAIRDAVRMSGFKIEDIEYAKDSL